MADILIRVFTQAVTEIVFRTHKYDITFRQILIVLLFCHQIDVYIRLVVPASCRNIRFIVGLHLEIVQGTDFYQKIGTRIWQVALAACPPKADFRVLSLCTRKPMTLRVDQGNRLVNPAIAMS